MVYLVTFANKAFYESQAELEKSALKYGVDQVLKYNEDDLIMTDFFKEHKTILTKRKGAGYWLWKPYYIYKTLKKINTNDTLVYLDAGISVTDDIGVLVEVCRNTEQKCMLFTNQTHKNSQYTKGDCFFIMDCKDEKYSESFQIDASVQVYAKCERTLRLVKEWLDYCTNPLLLTDCKNHYVYSNYPDFEDHRHDQSILSLLAVKYELDIFRDPSQWGDYLKMTPYRSDKDYLPLSYATIPLLNSPYGTLLNHHRKRDVSMTDKIAFHLERLYKKYVVRYI